MHQPQPYLKKATMTCSNTITLPFQQNLKNKRKNTEDLLNNLYKGEIKMAEKTIQVNNIAALTDALHVMMEKDKRVIVYGEDSGFEGGVFRATQGLQKDFGEDRCFDSPIEESAIAGFAIGSAMAGLRPVAEIQFSGFSFYTMQQMFGNAARMRNRSRGNYTVPMVLRMPCGGGVKALEHHSESIEAL